MRYVALLGDTLFTQIEVGKSNTKSEAWAMSLRAAIKAVKDKTVSLRGLALTQPYLYDTIKKITIYDEKFFVAALSQN